MFKDRASKGNVSPTSRNSIQQGCRAFVEDSLEKGSLGSLVGTYVGHFSIATHIRFNQTFNWRFGSISLQNARYLLPNALDDFFSFLNQLHRVTMYILDEAAYSFAGQGRDLVYILKQHIIQRIYKNLFEIYKACVC